MNAITQALLADPAIFNLNTTLIASDVSARFHIGRREALLVVLGALRDAIDMGFQPTTFPPDFEVPGA